MILLIGKLTFAAFCFLGILAAVFAALFLLGCRKLNEKHDIVFIEEALEKWTVSLRYWHKTEDNFWLLFNAIHRLDKSEKRQELYDKLLEKYKPYWIDKISNEKTINETMAIVGIGHYCVLGMFIYGNRKNMGMVYRKYIGIWLHNNTKNTRIRFGLRKHANR